MMKLRLKFLYLGIAILLGVAFIVLVLEITGVINLYHKSINKIDNQANTTSKATSARKDFSSGGDRSPNTQQKNEGIVSDNNGTIPTIPPPNLWIKSSNGDLTLYTPTNSAIVKSGDNLSGETNYNNVSFRLIDNVSGVIAQGQLKVVNGKYSGQFNFKTTATNGRLDVFNANPDGTELNNLEVPIRFQ